MATNIFMDWTFDQHINKGYIYFAMAFALMVELLNIRFRAKQQAT